MANTTQFFYEVLIMFSHNPRITCSDGFSISVQGSSFNYAKPREDNPPDGYTHVECGFPSTTPKTVELRNYAELCGTEDYTQTVYGYVPIEIVEAELDAHGGILDGCLPS